MKKLTQLSIYALIVVLSMNSCAVFLTPGKQKVTIKTDNSESEVYFDDELVSDSKSVKKKIKKSGVKQVVIKTPDHHNEYTVLAPAKSNPAYFALTVPSFLLFVYPGFIDLYCAKEGHRKRFLYDKELTFSSKYPLVYKTESEKYVNLRAIGIDVKDQNKDLNELYLQHKPENDLYTEIREQEAAIALAKEKYAAKQDAKKNKSKKKQVKYLEETKEDKKIQYEQTKFSSELYDLLNKTKYIDTVNEIFKDNNNTLVLDATIMNATTFYFWQTHRTSRFIKKRVGIMWYIKNTYGEIIDSVDLEAFSGEFTRNYFNRKDREYKLFSNAIMRSYSDLISSPEYKKNIGLVTDFSISDAPLAISKPSNSSVVKELSDANLASVIIKRKDKGHGSGFAISTDGYILTNFHVIAGKVLDQPEEIEVVLSNGIKIPAKVVRYNRATDIALIKVDYTFEKVFELGSEKNYKNYMEAYTIGAPKSVELGQTVTLGLISNEREYNKINLLQLSMSVNSGNSGGPLFDKTGVLHGIIKSKLVGYSTEGVGFAIPSFLVPGYLNISYN